MYFTYILHSESVNKYYVGSTKNLVNRLEEHNKGEGKYTKSGKLWNLITHFEFESKSEAIIFENKIKKRGIKRFLEDNNY
jgi:putative endonuclease